jgi:hypothetical protein
MVEHHKSADQIAQEALAIFVDTEGMPSYEFDEIMEALLWAIHQARGY